MVLEAEKTIIISHCNKLINLPREQGAQTFIRALKKTRLQLIHQGKPVFNRTFMRFSQMLPQLPEQLLSI